MAAKRFIITELENKEFTLTDKKISEVLMRSSDFDDIFSKAKTMAGKDTVYGITNIIEPSERHPKFKGFKTPVRCSYEF